MGGVDEKLLQMYIDADAEIREIVKNERETLSALSVNGG